MSWNSVSGAGASDTSSISTSRSVRPPIGVSADAPSGADHRVGERGVVGRKDAERIAHHVVEAGLR